MEPAKRARLEAQGWRFGNVAEFLALTPEESTLVEMKVALRAALRRRSAHLSEADVAKRVHSSVKAGLTQEDDMRGVSLEWLIRAMLAVGATSQEIGSVIAQAEA
jgi:hypothetical protein